MHERCVRLILGAVHVDVCTHARVVATGLLHDRACRFEERVAHALKLPESTPHALVWQAACEAALPPQVVGGVHQPRLHVDMAGCNEGDCRQLPITGLTTPALVRIERARFAQVIPNPTLGLQEPYEVQRTPDSLILAEGRRTDESVRRLEANGRQSVNG